MCDIFRYIENVGSRRHYFRPLNTTIVLCYPTPLFHPILCIASFRKRMLFGNPDSFPLKTRSSGQIGGICCIFSSFSRATSYTIFSFVFLVTLLAICHKKSIIHYLCLSCWANCNGSLHVTRSKLKASTQIICLFLFFNVLKHFF